MELLADSDLPRIAYVLAAASILTTTIWATAIIACARMRFKKRKD